MSSNGVDLSNLSIPEIVAITYGVLLICAFTFVGVIGYYRLPGRNPDDTCLTGFTTWAITTWSLRSRYFYPKLVFHKAH